MINQKIEFEKTGFFNQTFLDYLAQTDFLTPFYSIFPEIDHFKPQIEKKINFSSEKRKVLSEVLSEQYAKLTTSEEVEKNIELLKRENTFTVVTGHQLNIFTGPLYFIYKIVTVIRTCQELKKKFPDYNFVPVYWMASEDHDFEEISACYVDGKKYQWESDEKGAVGHFDPAELHKLANEIPGCPDFFKKAYKEDTLAEAVRYYVNSLFKKYGLVVIDADERKLKKLFAEVMEADLFHHKPKSIVSQTTAQLVEKGYSEQIFPREINLFLLEEQGRYRIEKKDDEYFLENGKPIAKADLQKILEESPEKLSPNVVLRPLYQEMILPNLSYVGGPSEVTYWLQLKGLFDHFNTPLPILQPRNFALVIPSHIHRKWNKTGFDIIDVFREKKDLIKEFTKLHSTHDISVTNEQSVIEELMQSLKKRAGEIDPTLEAHIEAQQTHYLNKIEGIGKKMLRAEKRVLSDKNGQIESVKDDLFPNGSLQERRDNFLNFYREDSEFIDTLMAYFDPFDFRMQVLIHE